MPIRGRRRRWRAGARGRWHELPSQTDHVRLALAPQPITDSRLSSELDPEHPRLLVGPLRELGAADAAREPEVVADQRARARLAADRVALDHERAQPLRGCVDRGGQARPGPAPTTTTSKSRRRRGAVSTPKAADDLARCVGSTRRSRRAGRHDRARSSCSSPTSRSICRPSRRVAGVEARAGHRCAAAGCAARACAASRLGDDGELERALGDARATTRAGTR